MTSFIALLTAYYMCDVTAANRMLSKDEVSTCAAHYIAVKAEFRDPTLAGREADRESYRRFKAWEAANPDLVRRLKARAAAALTETAA